MMGDVNTQVLALFQVIMIDITLAADNAVVVGLAASRVAREQRTKVIFWGIAGAVVLRILLALGAIKLMAIVGLTLAGGILLLWVCWKIVRELRPRAGGGAGPTAATSGMPQTMSFRNAVMQIIIADVSMSLDNVLAVAGAAKGSSLVLVTGLGFSIALMAIAASFVARVLARHRWLAWLGLAIILYVAIDMIWRGAVELAAHNQNL